MTEDLPRVVRAMIDLGLRHERRGESVALDVRSEPGGARLVVEGRF